MKPIIIQISARRYIIVYRRYAGITGGEVHGIEYDYADIEFGPASWSACYDWLEQQAKE